mgnify:CR=1 FL=1
MGDVAKDGFLITRIKISASRWKPRINTLPFIPLIFLCVDAISQIECIYRRSVPTPDIVGAE